jgi:excisionase family DNA binding protein
MELGMTSDTAEQDPVTISEAEQTALRRLEALLAETPNEPATLVGPSGTEVELPATVDHLLRRIVRHLAQDDAVLVVPIQKELTTQQAADILNVSRPYLITLLDRGEIPHHRVGTHRRMCFADVMAYKQRRDAARRAGLRRLTQMSQRLGLYGRSRTP